MRLLDLVQLLVDLCILGCQTRESRTSQEYPCQIHRHIGMLCFPHATWASDLQVLAASDETENLVDDSLFCCTDVVIDHGSGKAIQE